MTHRYYGDGNGNGSGSSNININIGSNINSKQQQHPNQHHQNINSLESDGREFTQANAIHHDIDGSAMLKCGIKHFIPREREMLSSVNELLIE